MQGRTAGGLGEQGGGLLAAEPGRSTIFMRSACPCVQCSAKRTGWRCSWRGSYRYPNSCGGTPPTRERWVGAVRREVLDRMLIFGRRQLRSVLAENAGPYDGHLPHRALGQAPPVGPSDSAVVPAGSPSYSFDRSDCCVGFST